MVLSDTRKSSKNKKNIDHKFSNRVISGLSLPARHLINKISHNSEEELLEKVRAVSEDYLYDTVEFNEFLQLMSKQQETAWTQEDLLASFK